MNALFLVHNHKFRGSYFRAFELARRFSGRGYNVQFAFTSEERKYRPFYAPADFSTGLTPPQFHKSLYRTPPEELSSFTWAEMPCFTFFNSHQEGWSLFDNGWRLKDALTRKWDVIYGFSHKPCCLLPALAGKFRGAKVILDWADWWGGNEGLYQYCVVPSESFQALPRPIRLGRRAVFALESWWEARCYKSADIVTLISEEFLDHPAAPASLRSKSIIMHSGAPLDQIVPLNKQEAREALGLNFSTDSKILGYVANFHMDERLLMEAFTRVSKSKPEVHLLMAGAPFEHTTPEQHQVTKGKIHHLGWLPFEKMKLVLGASDVLLLPLSDIALDRARYPHKLSDYVAAGRPIVACEVGETGRLLRKYKFGKLSAPNVEGFTHGILEAVDNPQDWEADGQCTRRAAEKHFDWDVITDNLIRQIQIL